MYGGIIAAIRGYQQRVKIEPTTQWIGNETKLWSYIQKGNKSVLSLTTKAEPSLRVFKNGINYLTNLTGKKYVTKLQKP